MSSYRAMPDCLKLGITCKSNEQLNNVTVVFYIGKYEFYRYVYNWATKKIVCSIKRSLVALSKCQAHYGCI